MNTVDSATTTGYTLKRLNSVRSYFQKEGVDAPPISTFLKNKTILRNLLIMTLVWMVTHYNLILMNFLLATFDDIWRTAIFSNVSDIIGYIFAGSVVYRFGIKTTLLLSFVLTSLGAIGVLVVGLENQECALFFGMIGLTKLGIASSYQIIYISHCQLFPTLFSATAIGWLQFASVLISALAPLQVAISDTQVIPMATMSALAAVTALSVCCLKHEHRSEQ